MRRGKRLPNDEITTLEAQLSASLVPVKADDAFVEGIGRQLRAQRPVYVPVARTWQQSWMLMSVLSGALLLLTLITTLLFMRHRESDA